MSYTLSEISGAKHLMFAGKNKFCPFITGIPYQDNLGRPGVMQTTCNSNCALFELQNDDKRVKLHCGCGPSFIINNESVKSGKKEDKILSISK